MGSPLRVAPEPSIVRAASEMTGPVPSSGDWLQAGDRIEPDAVSVAVDLAKDVHTGSRHRNGRHGTKSTSPPNAAAAKCGALSSPSSGPPPRPAAGGTRPSITSTATTGPAAPTSRSRRPSRPSPARRLQSQNRPADLGYAGRPASCGRLANDHRRGVTTVSAACSGSPQWEQRISAAVRWSQDRKSVV